MNELDVVVRHYREHNLPIAQKAKAQLTRFQNLAKAAKRWRKNWVDAEDILDSRGDCDCEICVLIRATDQLEEE